MADPVDDLTTAAVRAWATVAQAWFEAANAIVLSWVDMAAVESGRTAFNEETVLVGAQGATALRPGRFADWDDNALPPAAIAVVPAQVAGGEDTEVCVRVRAPGNVTSGTYTGSLLDSGGSCVAEEIAVYVVGGPAL